MAASTPPHRRVLLLVCLALFLSLGMFSGVTAQADFDDDADDDVELSQEVIREFEAADGGGTEVVASGDDVDENVAEELQLQPAPGVETTAIFPEFVLKKGAALVVRAGKQTELLFGINNLASSSLKLQGVLGRLYVPYDYSVVAQNFTGEAPSNVTLLNTTVPRGSQSSFSFLFTPFKMLQPMTFALAATVFYELDGTMHASVLYNSTLEVIEPQGFVSGETIFLVLLGGGVLTLLGIWLSSNLEALSKRTKKSKKVETGTGEESSAAANNEWLQGTFFKASQGKASQASKQRKRR